MVLRLDPTHAESFAETIVNVAAQHQAGEVVEVSPLQHGSGLVQVCLRPLDPEATPRVRDTAFGSMR